MISDNMDNVSHRANTSYLGLKGLTPKKIHENMNGVCADTVMASMFWDAERVMLVDYLDKGHSITVAMAAIQKCGFQLVHDPTYSLDYYLFPKMKT